MDPPLTMNKPITMASPPTSLHDLPTELILDICDFLALDALLALKLTSPRLNNVIRLDARRWQGPLSTCTQRAIRNHLKPSLVEAGYRHCTLCNASYPLSMFSTSSSPACLPIKLTAMPHDVVQLPPNMCAWHVGRLARVVRTHASGRNEWVARPDKMCMHCGSIQAWAKCGCQCESCSLWPVTTYTRHLNNSHECKKFVFWNDGARTTENGACRIWVRETCWDPDAVGHPSDMNLPVRFA